ncbi:hypothetical protein AB1G23_002474 [Escherichia coli]|nr:hypothetical protein [Escherichia coli]EHF0076713.1 hypothetical protein [Escherichia coli]EJF4179248.1 hypothetical protein [Escherichia coli]WFV59105.1 hypothetical protein NFJ42_00735 [Escherichia coli]HBA9803254.1 hypothetical protein [Escherichia coli]
MTIFNGLLEAKKGALKNGAIPALAIAIDAPNKKVAENIIIGKLWEAYPDHGDNYFKPKIWEDAPGQPRPGVGEFDEAFAAEHVFDGEKWAANTPVVSDTDDDSDCGATADDMTKLPPRERFAMVLLFSHNTNEIDSEMLSQTREYLEMLDNGDIDSEDEVDALNRSILDAMQACKPIEHMHMTGLNNLVHAILINCEQEPNPTNWTIAKFIKKWVENPGKRDELLPEAATEAAPARPYKQTHATLDREIACALLPVGPEKITPSVLKAADEIISQDREDFKRWSMALRTTDQILAYDRASVFGVIQSAPAKDTYHFPQSLRSHIDNWLHANGQRDANAVAEKPKEAAPKDDVKVTNHGGGRFSIDGMMSETPSNHGEKSEAANAGERSLQQLREQFVTPRHVYDVPENNAVSQREPAAITPTEETPPQEKLSEQVKDLVQNVDALVERIHTEEHKRQNAISAIETELKDSGDTDNLALWKNVFKTDERFTSAFSQNGGGTSINGTYIAMKATREFGPFGIGWGVEVVEERFDKGAPIVRKKQVGEKIEWDLIQDGVGGYLCEMHHTMKVRVWYMLNGVRGESEAYGCTPYIYDTKHGPTSDGEAPKKSWTDAVKKALSPLGFSADIFMGLYDNPEYRQRNKAEFDIKNASENAEDATRLRKELDEKLINVANTLAAAVTTNEVNKVFGLIAREVDVHRKAAEAKGDKEYSSYLGSRLRRITDIKTERLAALAAAQEQTA